MMLGLALAQIVVGGLTPAAWAGQAQQFTPEFKEVRKSLNPKHTRKSLLRIGSSEVNGSMLRFSLGAEESIRR